MTSNVLAQSLLYAHATLARSSILVVVVVGVLTRELEQNSSECALLDAAVSLCELSSRMVKKGRQSVTPEKQFFLSKKQTTLFSSRRNPGGENVVFRFKCHIHGKS